MTTDILPWLTFIAGSGFTYFMFWLEGRRNRKQQKKDQTLELIKRVYDPLLAEIDENTGSLKIVKSLEIFKSPKDPVKWEELGFSTSKWEYVKTSGFYHMLTTDLVEKLHELYSCLHEIRVWGGDVEGVTRGVEEMKIEAKLNNLSQKIKERIGELKKEA